MLGAVATTTRRSIYVYLEAGAQDSGKKDCLATLISDDDDAGDPGPTTCDPQVPAFSFKYPGKYLGKAATRPSARFYDSACRRRTRSLTATRPSLVRRSADLRLRYTVDSADGAHPRLIF